MDNTIEIINKVIDYIEDHLTKKLNLDDISNAVHYSKYHLHRIFSNTVGLTIHDYIGRRQLTEAAKLLVFSKKEIADIAFLAGYESQQSFTAIFKSMYKQSPNQFRQNEIFYPLQLRYNFKECNLRITGNSNKRIIRLADEDDLPVWLNLVKLVVDGFPFLIEEDYVKALRQYIMKHQAFIMEESSNVIGVMMINYDTGSIDFLGIHPLYRNQGIMKQFMECALNNLVSRKEIMITTFREGDKADTGYRKALKDSGFAEAELLTEFGYPTQKFIIKNTGKNELK